MYFVIACVEHNVYKYSAISQFCMHGSNQLSQTTFRSLLLIESACDSEEYYCPSGKCVLLNATCNGVLDCLDGADEPEICGDLLKGKTGGMTYIN